MSNAHCIHLLIAERNTALREVLAEYLGLEEDIEVVGQAAEGDQVHDLCRELHPDVLVIDPALQPDSAAFIRALHEENPDTKMIALTAPYNGMTRKVILEAGASKYAEKGLFGSELVALIRQVHQQN